MPPWVVPIFCLAHGLLVAMTNPIGRLPTSEPIESKVVNKLWLNDNNFIVAAPVSDKVTKMSLRLPKG